MCHGVSSGSSGGVGDFQPVINQGLDVSFQLLIVDGFDEYNDSLPGCSNPVCLLGLLEVVKTTIGIFFFQRRILLDLAQDVSAVGAGQV